jgi:hypothetical protein
VFDPQKKTIYAIRKVEGINFIRTGKKWKNEDFSALQEAIL